MGWHKLNVDAAGDINRGLFGSSSVIQRPNTMEDFWRPIIKEE